MGRRRRLHPVRRQPRERVLAEFRRPLQSLRRPVRDGLERRAPDARLPPGPPEDPNGDGWRDVIVSTTTTSCAGPGCPCSRATRRDVRCAGPRRASRERRQMRPGTRTPTAYPISPSSTTSPRRTPAVRWILGSASNAFTVMPPQSSGPRKSSRAWRRSTGTPTASTTSPSHTTGSSASTSPSRARRRVGAPPSRSSRIHHDVLPHGRHRRRLGRGPPRVHDPGTIPLLTRFRNLGGGSWVVLPGVSYPNTYGGGGVPRGLGRGRQPRPVPARGGGIPAAATRS